MSNFIRTAIFEKVVKTLQNVSSVNQHRIMSSLFLTYNNINDVYSFSFPLKSKFYNVTNEVENILNINLEGTFDDVLVCNDHICMNIARDKYVKKVVENNLFGVMPPLLIENNKNIIVEFSSPNIAKPFHLGHLRSTIIGNCIANISTFLRNKVTRINYLGDWGTQIGYIQLGMHMAGICNSQLGNNPLRKLYEVYVMANQAAVQDPELHEQAKSIFKKLENGEASINKNWHEIKHFTVLELEKTYKRIGVTFDKYDWESMYSTGNIMKLIKSMEDMQLVILDSYNRKLIPINDREVPITKSDGTSLYITRDIAAAIDRYERNKFDVMYYVVDYSQSDHFSTLINVLNKMKLPWADRLKHIKFGRVHGMSTRAGTAVFLEDVLDEAQNLMKMKQMKAKTTKVTGSELDKASDILGVSNVIVHSLKQNRMNSYEFNWEAILDQVTGDSGTKLQYAHCRLCSLQKLLSGTMPAECDPSTLREPEVDNLILLISQFDDIVLKTYNTAESCVLTTYLFSLCKAINVAMLKLRIKYEQNDLGNQRLLLFHVARHTLAQGMKLLGLTPLQKM